MIYKSSDDRFRSILTKLINSRLGEFLLYFIIIYLFFYLVPNEAYSAQIRLPGEDNSSKLEAAGTLLRLVDTALFKWGARIFAGLGILSAGFHLKDQRFGLAVISVIGAIIMGTSPLWVKNIFDIGGGSTLFSYVTQLGGFYV